MGFGRKHEQEIFEQLKKQRDIRKEIADADRMQAEADAKKRQAENDKIRQKEQLARLEKNTIESLKLQTVELLKGKEAARQLQLEMQGLDKNKAAQFAQLENELRLVQKRIDANKNQQVGDIQARESRTLTGAGGVNPHKQVADNTRQQVELTKQQTTTLTTMLGAINNLGNQLNNNVLIVKNMGP